MAKRERTAEKREQDLVTLSELLIQGLSSYKMAEIIGVSQTQIEYDKKDLNNRWKEAQVSNIDEKKQSLLRELSFIKKELYGQWNKSKEDALKEVLKSKAFDKKDKKDGSLEKNNSFEDKNNIGFYEETITQEGRNADPRYMAVIVSCIKEESEILGIKKIESNLNLSQNLVNISVKMDHPELAELIRQNENSLKNFSSEDKNE